MVKLTVHFITKKGSPNAPKHGQDNKHHIRRLTHLYLQDQYIDSIGDISACKNLRVLYLQNNLLECIENLHFASNLTHLYLQRNKLSRIDGLQELHSLRKLYLGHNYISVVENLEGINFLQELHLERQQLAPGEELHFDPRTIITLQHSLKTLNLQGNRMASLADLVGLDALQSLNAACNHLDKIEPILAVVAELPSLRELDMRDNSVCADYKNCDKIIACAMNLSKLNGKEIPPTTRDFVQRFEFFRERRSETPKVSLSSDLIAGAKELAHSLPDGVKREVANSIMRNSAVIMESMGAVVSHKGGLMNPEPELLKTSHTEDIYNHFPAFKSTTSFQFEGHTVPRPFQRHKNQGLLSNRHCRLAVTLPPQVTTNVQDANLVHEGNFSTNISAALQNNAVPHTGDMVSEVWASDDTVKGRTESKCERIANSTSEMEHSLRLAENVLHLSGTCTKI